MTQPLTNYLRTHRRRSAFSLEELGFLLGHRSGSAAGKHERFRRLPTVTSVFAYEVVFQAPTRELFAGLYDQVERDTVRRALKLANRPSQSENARTIRNSKFFNRSMFPLPRTPERMPPRR